MRLTNTTVGSLPKKDKPYDKRDEDIKGFLVRVHPSGRKVYYLVYKNKKGEKQRYQIGVHGTISTSVAREAAQVAAGRVAVGEDIQQVKKETKKHEEAKKSRTLRSFLDNKYEKWAMANLKSGKATMKRINGLFADMMETPLEEIDLYTVEEWRAERLDEEIAAATINRDVTCLKALLSKAVEWEIIETHPLTKLKPLKVDSHAIVRYLDDDEYKRLTDALDKREKSLREARTSHNEWLKVRLQPLQPVIPKDGFTDYLKPMVLLSLNTGLRQGELFSLRWNMVDLDLKNLTVAANTTKNKKTRHIPLNSEALEILRKWKKYHGDSDLVFQSPKGGRFNNISTSWKNLLDEALVNNFRWHDLRHDFASKLVMAGVDLNTVRELMGHSTIQMTLRYAHLAPKHKADAVEKLVK